MALYDISAKAAGLPLYKFLNGTKRVIETDITTGINTPEKMAEQALEFKNMGATIIKVKLGKDAEEDIKRITAIREAVGPDITLRIDANQGWEFDDATDVLDIISHLDIEFCEQPLRTCYDYRMTDLVWRSPIRIMADESVYNHWDARKLIRAKGCDYINIKLAKSGGILEALQLHELAASEKVECMLGGMLESRLAMTANLHLAYACPGIIFFDLDSAMIGHLEDPITGGMKYNGFFPEIDDTPGIGADVDPEFLSGCEQWTIN